MSNHYHLLVETPAPNLVRDMTWFQATCTVRYDARHKVSGHLFAGRYKALLVDPESEGHFMALLNYIHLDPAGRNRAGWRWGKPTGLSLEQPARLSLASPPAA